MSAKYEFVTSFSPEGYQRYGQKLIDSFVEHVDHPLVVYHESQPNVDFHTKLTWRNLDHDEERETFLKECQSHVKKGTEGLKGDFNAMIERFSHKIFAISHAASVSYAEWLIWLDGDVVFTSTPKLDKVLPDDALLAYLGRDPKLNTHWHFNGKWRPICSETGFVAYKVRSFQVRKMLEEMRRWYTSYDICKHPPHERHDAFCFDYHRKLLIDEERWCDMSKGFVGGHVWPRTRLADFCHHNKGQRKDR